MFQKSNTWEAFPSSLELIMWKYNEHNKCLAIYKTIHLYDKFPEVELLC